MSQWCLAKITLGLLLTAFPLSLFAQSVPPVRSPFDAIDAPNTGSHDTYNFQGAVLRLNVVADPHSPLDRQALVKLSNPRTYTTQWQSTQDKAQAVFYDVPIGTYDIEVSAVGYLPARSTVKVMTGMTTYTVDVLIKRDPLAFDIGPSTDMRLPRRVNKRLDQAVKDLRSGFNKRAEKNLRAAYQDAPNSADVHFLLAYAASQQGNAAAAKESLSRALQLDPHHAQSLLFLAELYIRDADYQKSKAALQTAIVADDTRWLSHYLLAETELHLSEYQEARVEAQRALDRGHANAIDAEMVLGEALANTGETEEAGQAFQRFLHDAPDNPLAPQVRVLLTKLESQRSAPGASARLAMLPSASPASLLSAEEDSLRHWWPRDVDEESPGLVAGASCPQDTVITNAGLRIKDFINDVREFSAIEQISHEELDARGNPRLQSKSNFNYIASISENPNGVLSVTEDRMQKSDLGEFPQSIATRGLPTLALIFHPNNRDNFEMRCEGLGQWHGKPTWVVHFRQRENRPRSIKAYVIGPNMYPLALKGRAWIVADSFQIVRIESDLVSPLPEIQLRSDHETVEYGAVRFEKKKTTLWLPKSAELYFDLRHRHYHRTHSFDHFMLFAVDSTDKPAFPSKEVSNRNTDSQPN